MKPEPQEYVILLHGLCRTSRSMEKMERALFRAGYRVVNVDYPSRTAPIEQLSAMAISAAIETCLRAHASQIHFVTHSLGGILVRHYLANHTIPQLGRVVMLGPPNQGSEVVDRLRDWKLFTTINGPAGLQLGTDRNSAPNRLGRAMFPVGVIAGNRSVNWINSCFIRGRNDGKVSVARTRLAGMADHLVVEASHPFLMRNRNAIRQTIAFLRNGRFEHARMSGRSGGVINE
jgi:pimeloyl-ACP methyl ester carboxylesterase